ncbi:NET1-associated nuclear protein 1, partial [Dispira parvispora]
MVSKSDSAGEGSALPTDTVKSSSLPVSMELDAPAHSAESEKLQKRGKKKSKRSKATSSKKLTEAVHKDVENVPEIVKERNKMVGITSVHDRWMSHIAKSRSHWFFDNFMRNVERGSRPRGATKGEAQGFTCVADMAGDITLNGVLTTSDSQYLVGFKSVTVVVYSVANGEKVLSFSVSNWITAIALHATTPSLLYVATTDGMISLWNILNGTMVNYWNVGHHVLSLVQSPKLPETLFAWVGKVDVDNVPQPKALYEQCVYAFSLQDTKDHTVQEQYLAGGRNFYDLALSPTGEFLGILSHREVEVFQIQASLQQGELPTKLTISLRDEGARLLFGPEPDCLTVGHYQGRFTRFKLNTNMNLLDSYTRIHSVHWFPSEIQSMDYLKEDNSLLICGLHFVAVIYKLDTNTFRFVSGLGVGIRQLLVTKDQRNMVFVLNTGSIHFITPQQLSSRAAIHGLRVSPEIPVSAFTVTSPPRLVVHPSTQYVMLNTIFSSLQLYDPLTDQGISEISLDTVSIHTGDTALNREPGKIGSVAFS